MCLKGQTLLEGHALGWVIFVCFCFWSGGPPGLLPAVLWFPPEAISVKSSQSQGLQCSLSPCLMTHHTHHTYHTQHTCPMHATYSTLTIIQITLCTAHINTTHSIPHNNLTHNTGSHTHTQHKASHTTKHTHIYTVHTLDTHTESHT